MSANTSDELLESLLDEALRQQSSRRRRRRTSKLTATQTATDYAHRLAEKALYRRLINESNVAQDGIRFIAYFGSPAHSAGLSLDEWRRRIDKEIACARSHPK